MDAKVEQPPQKMKKKNRTINPPPLLFLSLPEEIILNCLARISRSHYRSLSLVSKTFRSLIYSPELYQFRSLIRNTEPFLYLWQSSHPYDRLFFLDQTLITDGWIKNEVSLSLITPSSSAPSMSTTVAVGFEIYQMGGTINKRPSSAVCVFDCRTYKWRDAPNMTVARTLPQSAFIDGKIYVVGGADESSSMIWAEVFNLKTHTWKPLSSPTNTYPAKFKFRREKLYVRSEDKDYVYDSKEGRWKELLELDLSQEYKSGPSCVIENIMFSVHDDSEVDWFDSERRKWSMVKGLEDLDMKQRACSSTIRLANYGGKLVILWDQRRPPYVPVERNEQGTFPCQRKSIWCVVIWLEKRIDSSGLQVVGKIERSNAVLIVPDSFKFLSCIIL